MNLFSGTALEGAAKELLEPTKAAASAEPAANRTRGPPKAQNAAQVDGEGKTSIEYDKENRPFVVVETDILAGVPKSQWVKTVKDNLRQKFPDGVTVGRNTIQIDKQSVREMTFSKYTQRLMKTKPDLFADKLRATDSADEILKASRNYVNEALMHPRKDSIQEFARGEVLLRIGRHDYTAQVVVAMRSNGKLLLYDILGLERTTIQQKKKSDTAIAKNPSLGTDRSTVSDFKDSISAPGEDVKGKSSRELKGKYWRPSLKSEEWDLLNRKMETAGQPLDEATCWVYASEKGTSVFAVYGIGDGTENTPLYASGGEQAVADGKTLADHLEGRKNGVKRRTTVVDRLLKYLEDQRGDAGGHLHDRTGARDRDVPVSLGQPGSDGRGSTGQGAGDRGGVKPKFSQEITVEEYTDQEKKDHAKTALEHFGQTYSWKETGYLTQDGKRIDFSGRHDGAPGGYRTVDHRDIREALGVDYGGDSHSGGMVQFMAEGNIRIIPETKGINLSVLPTKAQEVALDDFISKARGEVIVDFDTPGGDTVFSVEYPKGTYSKKIIRDIRQYFTDGTKPYVSETAKFRFSQELESIEELRKSIEAVQSIGRKSVNELTAAELQKVEPFARRYWREMGEKSPFFRAWFGDWRANDATPVKVVGAAEAIPFKAGKAVNADTGKTISWGDTLKGETSIHGNATERAALGQIKSIVENAVLLDTETSSRSSKSKMPGTAFMHSFYALVEDGEGTSLYKLFAEEAISAKSGEPFTRAYELKSIKKVASAAKGVLSQTEGLTQAASTTGYSVADLFDLVKRSDAAFRPKDASKVVDEDGRPLVVYHGTAAEGFWEFDSESGNYWFSEERDYAEAMAEERDGERIIPAYLDLKNPYYAELTGGQWSDPNAEAPILRYAKKHGHDGVILKNPSDNPIERDTFYIVFTPEQIKSATDNVGTFNAENPDIRFSQELESIEELRRENEELKERLEEFKGIRETARRKTAQAEYWKGQTRRTTPETLTVRQDDVRRLARKLTKDWSATASYQDIARDLTDLGEYLLRGEKGTGEVDSHTAWEKAQAIGKRLVETAQVQDDTLYNDYSDLRAYLREADFQISEEDSHDIADFGDFRKRNFGRLRIKRGATNIDRYYQEMSARWPGFFDGKRENSAGDMLLRMAEVLDELRPVYSNPYSYDLAEATQYATEAVLDGVMGESVRRQAPTFADRQARKLEQAVAKGKQAAAREREKRDAAVKRLKEHYAQTRQAQAERRADSKARSRLLSIAKRLNSRKLPAANRALLDQYIGELDLTAKSMTGATLKKLSDLRDWYNGKVDEHSDAYDPDFLPDEVTERKLERLSKRQINDLTAQEVAELTEALLNIENEIRTKKKLIDTQDRRDVYHMGQEVIRDLENVKGSKAAGLSGAADKLIVTETLSPVRQVRRMVGYVDSDPLLKLTNALADGQRAMLDHQMRAEKPFETFASDDKFTADFSGRKAKAIQVTGMTKDGPAEVTITPAMRASLYLHSLNSDNLRHIKEGGVTVPDEKLYRDGKIEEAYARGTTVKLTPSQVRAITAGMTEREKAYAKEAEKYFSATSPTEINAVSEKLKGYPIAQVEHYFPINTDTSFTRADFEAIKKDGSIEGMGWTKERVTRAAAPILLRDLDAVLEQSIRQHAKYVGLAIGVRNFNKVWQVTEATYNEDGSRSSYEASVQKAVKRAWGETGYRYIEKMMADLQGDTKPKNAWAKALARVRSNYAGAVLTLNASVAMKQAASYPTAAVLGWRPLLRAMGDVGKVDLDLIARYTPLQWYRSKGYSTKELGDINTSNRSRFKALDWMRGKDLPPVLNWVQAMDLLTTRKLWKATEYSIRDTRKDLTVGTDAYYKAVAEVYNRVIEETQPNYTTMQRPQLLRSEDSLLANLAMFKHQLFQNFNLLYDAAGNWAAKARYAKAGGEEQRAEEKTARRDLGRAVSSQLVQLAVCAGMTAVWAFFRGKTDKYEDEDEGEVTAESFLAAFGKDMMGGLLSDVPFGSEAWEALSSKMFGDAYYGMDVTAVSAVSDTIQAVDGLTSLVGTVFRAVTGGEEVNWNSARLELDGYLDDVSKAAGVPYENVVNLFNAAYRQTVTAAMGEYRGGYAYLKLTTDPERYAADYYDLLYKAMKNSPEDYRTIYQDMLDFGFTADKVRSAMEARMKKDQGVKDVEDLESRYLSPDEQAAYDETLGQISGSAVWREATEEQRDKAEDILYDLAVGNSAGAKLREKIEDGAEAGVDEGDRAWITGGSYTVNGMTGSQNDHRAITPADWEKEGVEWAVENGLMAGAGDLMLHSPITRSQLCVMLKRYHETLG